MQVTLQAIHNTVGQAVTVEREDVDDLGDVAEMFLTFLHGAGYSYVRQVVIVKDDGEEVTSL